MLKYVSKEKDDDVWYFSAYDQRWDKETIKELYDEHNIIFMPNGKDAVHAVMLLIRNHGRPGIAIGYEDDGTIYFDRSYGRFEHQFDSAWLDSLIQTLTVARDICKEVNYGKSGNE